MREMRWTWDELQATPVDVRTYCWDLIQMERSAAAERADQAKNAVKDEPGAIRIPR